MTVMMIMNELPQEPWLLVAINWFPVLYALKGSGIARGQTLQVTIRKCMAETYFDVQKTILERDQRFFRYNFIRNRCEQCLIRGKCKFLFE